MSTPNNAPYSASLKAEILSEALPYIPQFHGRAVVVKYSGKAMTDEQLQRSFAHDVVLLKLVGPKPVAAHGRYTPIIEALRLVVNDASFIHGMLVTLAETTKADACVLCFQVKAYIVTLNK